MISLPGEAADLVRSFAPFDFLWKAGTSVNTDPMMMHSTYFSLKPDSSPEVRARYMAACHQYLSASPGIMSFWVGERALDMTRPVNDANFNIAMNQIFQNKAAFDRYNGHDPMHDEFIKIATAIAPQTTRRVYDSYLNRLSYIDGQPVAIGPAQAGSQPLRLFHSIYFSLTTNTPEARTAFTQICLKYLADHPGVRAFAIGELADMKREVSVVNYDIAMNILWKNKASYDAYLASPSHDAFFPATAGMIQATQVFDSYLH